MTDDIDIPAFSNISFNVGKGEFLAIIGPSGAGKSSILKCIYRTYLPTSGHIFYLSRLYGLIDLVDAPERKIINLRAQEIGYVSQFLKVIPRVPALDVVAGRMLPLGYSVETAREQAGKLLTELQIPENLWYAYPVTFSGGEQQRINLARSFITRPRLLLLDEPTASLDEKTKKDDEKKELIEKERIIMQEAGALAAEHNIIIGMENLRPYLDCPHYSYSEIPTVLAEQVKAIDRPSIGITLDLGHLLLASKVYGLDIEEQMTAIAPLVVHIHAHDNFGRPSYSSEKDQYALVPRGMGDMHMPVGEGTVPLEDILNILYPYYDGYIINELRDRYESKWETVYVKWNEILKSMMPVTIKSERWGLYGK